MQQLTLWLLELTWSSVTTEAVVTNGKTHCEAPGSLYLIHWCGPDGAAKIWLKFKKILFMCMA